MDGDSVHYEALLARVNPPTDVYRTGNDLRGLLTQRMGNVISATVPPPVLAQQPDYGLPGLRAELQKQVRMPRCVYVCVSVCVCVYVCVSVN